MAIQNDFLPFAVGAGANVLTQSAYAALAAIESGYQAGTAQSAACNKTWRQSSVMTAVIAQFIVAQTGQPAIDDGTTGALLANFTQAVSAASRNSVVLVDTGSANAYAAANAAPFTALPTATGIAQTFSVAHANTGASTYAPDGLPAAPIFGAAGLALQGGELVVGGIATLMSYVGPLINGGSLCWVLVRSVGGALQVPPATQSNHALQLGQAVGRLINVQRFSASGTYSPTPGTTTIIVEGVGGGGGGGGCPSCDSSHYAASGGGASGTYARTRLTGGFTGSIPVTIGAAGAAGSAGANAGTAGGTTSFGSLITFPGGGGSPAGVTVTTGTTLFSSSGASGGSAIGSTNLANVLGQGGGVGLAAQVGLFGGAGGSNELGGGTTQVGPGTPGIAAGGWGGGGSGSTVAASGGALAGGAGASGYLIVYEYA
ncbi:hypothetical protein DF056_20910 [Burkholderia cepacia]|uniref:glycine-rich domain-containing protein n=1 Tax=Burkholderia cepacia TaxID=292 RepID=UPI000F5D6DF5|nr:hypothetical protein [Burkholderia cepacia]RQZ78856.1 hypothetical protein DF056_20910 [Burkholderia cepacia]